MSLLYKPTSYSPIPFSVWILDNREDLERQFEILYGDTKKFPAKCDECGGIGYQECDLGHDHDCEECAGSGDTPDIVEQFMLDEYHDQVKKDTKVFEKYKKEFSDAS